LQISKHRFAKKHKRTLIVIEKTIKLPRCKELMIKKAPFSLKLEHLRSKKSSYPISLNSSKDYKAENDSNTYHLGLKC
jgi:hypothetical protein